MNYTNGIGVTYGFGDILEYDGYEWTVNPSRRDDSHRIDLLRYEAGEEIVVEDVNDSKATFVEYYYGGSVLERVGKEAKPSSSVKADDTQKIKYMEIYARPLDDNSAEPVLDSYSNDPFFMRFRYHDLGKNGLAATSVLVKTEDGECRVTVNEFCLDCPPIEEFALEAIANGENEATMTAYNPWNTYEGTVVIFEGRRWRIEKKRKHDCDLMRVQKDSDGLFSYCVVGREKVKNEQMKPVDDGERMYRWLEGAQGWHKDLICRRCREKIDESCVVRTKIGFNARRPVTGNTRWGEHHNEADQDSGSITWKYVCPECGVSGSFETCVELPPYEQQEN